MRQRAGGAAWGAPRGSVSLGTPRDPVAALGAVGNYLGARAPNDGRACRHPRIRRPHGTRKDSKTMHAQGRHWTLAALVPALALVAACSGYDSPTYPGPTPPPPAPAVRLKEVVIDRLPSPFYHFDYDGTGRIVGASYA